MLQNVPGEPPACAKFFDRSLNVQIKRAYNVGNRGFRWARSRVAKVAKLVNIDVIVIFFFR